MVKLSMIQRVQALIAKAESTTFEAEREAYLAKADELMTKHAISEWELGQAKPNQRIKPVRKDMTVCSNLSDLVDTLTDLAYACVLHAGAKAVFTDGRYKMERPIKAMMVGFPDDLEYAELLFISLKLQLMVELEPKPDSKLTYEENLAMLKEAGLKWTRTYELLVEAGMLPDVPWERRYGVRFTKEYTEYCSRTGRPRTYVNPTTYRKNFGTGFLNIVKGRLWELQRHRSAFTTGKEMVIVSRKEEVKDAFDTMFPNTTIVPRGKSKFEASAFNAGTDSGAKARITSAHSMSTHKQLG